MRIPDPLPCPLPALRERYSDDGNEVAYVVERCGEPLAVVVSGATDLDDDDDDRLADVPLDDLVTIEWRVECHAGHVLLIHDTEDREAPLTIDFIDAARDLVTK